MPASPREQHRSGMLAQGDTQAGKGARHGPRNVSRCARSNTRAAVLYCVLRSSVVADLAHYASRFAREHGMGRNSGISDFIKLGYESRLQVKAVCCLLLC